MVAFSYNVADTSPLWRYQPFPDYLGPGYQNGTGVQLGWQTRWSDSGFLGTSNGSPNFGESGQGTSSHITSNLLANATLTFNGTDITLYGISNGSYHIVLDGQPGMDKALELGNGVLVEQHGLSPGEHTITISPQQADGTTGPVPGLELHGATISYSLPDTFTTIQNTTIDNGSKNDLVYAGNWTSKFVKTIPSTAHPKNFSETSQAGASVSLAFSGAFAVDINGVINYGGLDYTVDVNGVTTHFNGSSVWLIPNGTLFSMAGLDVGANHTIKLTNTGGGIMRLNDITLFAGSSNSTNSSSPSLSIAPPPQSTAGSSSSATSHGSTLSTSSSPTTPSTAGITAPSSSSPAPGKNAAASWKLSSKWSLLLLASALPFMF